jgi:hypothetical protein
MNAISHIYNTDWIYKFYIEARSFLDVFWNEAEDIVDEDEAFDVLYEFYMQNIICWMDLPDECRDEDGCELMEVENEAEKIIMFLLPLAIKESSGLKRRHKQHLKNFISKMNSWLFSSEYEKKEWSKHFSKTFKISLTKDGKIDIMPLHDFSLMFFHVM